MQLRKLYRTIENIASQNFATDEELLRHVIHQIVANEEIDIKGGRVWKFDSKSASYELVHQAGEMDPIKKNYRVKLTEYPMFLELPKSRTVLGSEQDQYLRNRGIVRYSATGIGDKISWRGKPLYRYVLAFNADSLNENLEATLNIISSALTSVLRTKRMERKARDLERDLDEASQIQRSILPDHEMRFDHFELYGISVPDKIVGGDFFDYLPSEEGDRLGFVIGDATNKGVSAAVQALYVSGALRMGFMYQTKISSLMSRVNKLLNKAFSEEHFVSLFYGELTDDKNGLVLYANCGHCNPVLMRAGGLEWETIETTSQLLGPFPNETFRTGNFHLYAGDILLLYTDGVSEAMNEQREMYGEERLVGLLGHHHDKSPKEITQAILDDVITYSAASPHSDDKTLVVIKRNS